MKELAIAFFVAMSSMAFGATVVIAGFPANRLGVQAAEGGPLLTGENSYYLSVGSFSVPPVVTDAASLVEVVNSFISLGSAVVAPLSGTMGGVFNASGPQVLANQPIYVFVHNTADLMSATQVAILRAITQVFPPDISSPLSGSVTLTSSLAGMVEVVGEVTDAPAGFDYVTMVEVVPEPSTALLGLLGVAGLIRRRR